MHVKYLLPATYKWIGWLILLPGLLLGIPTVIFDWSPAIFDITVFSIFTDSFSPEKQQIRFIRNNILNELLGLLIIVGGIIVAFSKERDEDELISKMRLESLVWAIYWNYGILLVALLLVYDLGFYWIMIFNMFTPLLLFIIRFTWVTWKFRQSPVYEK